MRKNRAVCVFVVVGTALGMLAQARPSSSSSSCSSSSSSFVAELGQVLRDKATGGLQDSQDYRYSAIPEKHYQGGSGSSYNHGGSSYEPSETGDWSWIFQLSERYRVIESDIAAATLGQEGHLRSWETDINAFLVGDRWGLAISVPYRTWEGYGVYENLGGESLSGESLGLHLTPQYSVMQQDSEGIDLSVFVVAGYERVWFTDDPGPDDIDYVTYGAGALIGRTFGFGDVSLGYCYQPWMNIDGDDELDGTSTMAYHSAALTYTASLGCGFVGSLQAIWEYTEDLPDTYDSDQYLGRATVNYDGERWGVRAGLGRTLYSDDFSEWSAELSAVYRW